MVIDYQKLTEITEEDWETGVKDRYAFCLLLQNNLNPISSSSIAMFLLKEGWEIWIICAAVVKFSVSVAARKHSIKTSFIAASSPTLPVLSANGFLKHFSVSSKHAVFRSHHRYPQSLRSDPCLDSFSLPR